MASISLKANLSHCFWLNKFIRLSQEKFSESSSPKLFCLKFSTLHDQHCSVTEMQAVLATKWSLLDSVVSGMNTEQSAYLLEANQMH